MSNKWLTSLRLTADFLSVAVKLVDDLDPSEPAEDPSVYTTHKPDHIFVFRTTILEGFLDDLCAQSSTEQKDKIIDLNQVSWDTIYVFIAGEKYVKLEANLHSVGLTNFLRFYPSPPFLSTSPDGDLPYFYLPVKGIEKNTQEDKKVKDRWAKLGFVGFRNAIETDDLFYGAAPIDFSPSDLDEYDVPEIDKKYLPIVKGCILLLDRELKEILQEGRVAEFSEREHSVYYFIFQQIEMLMTLLARGLIPPDITKKREFFYFFINHLYTPGSFGPYLRFPLNYFSFGIGKYTWQSIVSGETNMLFYQYVRNLQKGYAGRVSRPNGNQPLLPLPFILIPARMEDRDQYNKSLKLPHVSANRELGFYDVKYNVTFRDERMRTAKLSTWNLKLDKDDKYEQLDEDLVLYLPHIEHKHVTVNGVEFLTQDLLLLYNTALLQTVSRGEADIYIPQLQLRDLRLLRQCFLGRCSLLYLYENISKYAYFLMSGQRTMLELFDLIPVRKAILDAFSIGLPLREQLALIKYEGIPRLNELRDVAKGE